MKWLKRHDYPDADQWQLVPDDAAHSWDRYKVSIWRHRDGWKYVIRNGRSRGWEDMPDTVQSLEEAQEMALFLSGIS